MSWIPKRTRARLKTEAVKVASFFGLPRAKETPEIPIAKSTAILMSKPAIKM